MATIPTEQQYIEIIKWVQDHLEGCTVDVNDGSGGTDMIYATRVQDLQKDLPYSEYKEAKGGRKTVKKLLPVEVEKVWQLWWSLWPSMRTFEYKGKKFVCNKPLKRNQEKMKEKWLAIISKEIGADWLYKAADNYLKSTMIDSYRKGRNEMEYVSGMEPWLNQKQWRNWLEVEVIDAAEANIYTEA